MIPFSAGIFFAVFFFSVSLMHVINGMISATLAARIA